MFAGAGSAVVILAMSLRVVDLARPESPEKSTTKVPFGAGMGAA